jgi:hypothetical protein
MIVTETITINNTQYQRTYSDNGFCVERDGVQYDEAIDPIDSGRTYTETDIPISADTAGEEDYINALESLGVNFNE